MSDHESIGTVSENMTAYVDWFAFWILAVVVIVQAWILARAVKKLNDDLDVLDFELQSMRAIINAMADEKPRATNPTPEEA